MDPQAMTQAMRDPLGLPFYAIVFQVLMVLTFALHILMVNITIGVSFLAFFGKMRADANWKRVGKALSKAATVSISMAILLGIAPLLFVQLIYDPFWYASNLLSASWVISFLFIMMAGFWFIYIQYLSSKERPGAGIAGFLLLFAAGVIMHIVVMQMLFPEKWLSWYAPAGIAITSGWGLHTFKLSRFLHFLLASGAVTGVFLMLYARYIQKRSDMEENYVAWAGNLGANLFIIFTLLQIVDGFWWLFAIPGDLRFYMDPTFIIAFIVTLPLLFLMFKFKKDPIRWALPAAILMFVSVLAMSAARETLRMAYVAQFNYSIYDYNLNIHWGSTVLFLLTFVAGLFVTGFLIMVAYRSGQSVERYIPSPGLMRYGKWSIAVMVIWMLVVVGMGILMTLTQ